MGVQCLRQDIRLSKIIVMAAVRLWTPIRMDCLSKVYQFHQDNHFSNQQSEASPIHEDKKCKTNAKPTSEWILTVSRWTKRICSSTDWSSSRSTSNRISEECQTTSRLAKWCWRRARMSNYQTRTITMKTRITLWLSMMTVWKCLPRKSRIISKPLTIKTVNKRIVDYQ